MKDKPTVRIELDPSYTVPEIVIRTDKKTPEIEKIIYAIENESESDLPKIKGYNGSAVTLLDQRDLVRAYTEHRKVLICTASESYESRRTLRELEEMLDEDHFVRISRFEIINLDKVRNFDFSLAGTIKVNFEDGNSTWVARRYVKAIEERLERLQSGRRGSL